MAQAERMGRKIGTAEGPPPDEIRAYNGKVQWNRRTDRDGSVHFLVDRPGHLAHWFQPPSYLREVGLAVLDPVEKDKQVLDAQRMALLPDLLEQWSYLVQDEPQKIDSDPCVVLSGTAQLKRTVGQVSDTLRFADKLWLSLAHGLAIRQREIQPAGHGSVRTVNSEFDQVLPGLWLPRKSELHMIAPPGSPDDLQGRDVMVLRMELLKCVINQVPDDLFDMVTKPGDHVEDLRDRERHGP